MTSEQPKENDDDDDEMTEFIRNEAINLIDGILDESLNIVNTQQLQCNNNYIDINNQNNDYNSESENYAITCDVVNGIDIVKSPTIESLSGKSFDDNMSVCDETNNILFNIPNISASTTPPTNIIEYTTSSTNLTTFVETTIATTDTPLIMTTTINNAAPSSNATNNLVNINEHSNLSDFVLLDYNHDNILNPDYNNDGNNINNETNQSNNIESNCFNKEKKRFDRIDKKFERLSSQIDDINEFVGKFDNDFDKICSNDDLNNVQNDFSKISWDESVSLTTTATNTAADVGLSTPDNDLQDLPTESGGKVDSINTDIVKPKPTPRLSKTISNDEQIIQLADQITNNQNIISKTTSIITTDINTDLESDTITIDVVVPSTTTTDVDFKHSKKFWESLESQGSDVLEEKKKPKASNIPVPKPRSKTTPTDSIKAVDSVSSIKSNSISSEQQVEFSETSSGATSFDEKILKEDDSIISDIKITDEVYLEKTEIESTTLESNITKPGFYIGESSLNLITRSERTESLIDTEDLHGILEKEHDIEEDIKDSLLESNKYNEELIEISPEKLEFKDDLDIAIKHKNENILEDTSPKNVLRTIETVDDIAANFTTASLSETEKEHFESKLFRQGSETRNDILEFEIEGKYTENENCPSKTIPEVSENIQSDKIQESIQNMTVVEQEFVQPSHFVANDKTKEEQIEIIEITFDDKIAENETDNQQKTVEFYNIQYEDQTTPILQEAIEELIPTQIVEVLDTQVIDFSDFEQQIQGSEDTKTKYHVKFEEIEGHIPQPQMAEFDSQTTHIIETTLVSDVPEIIENTQSFVLHDEEQYSIDSAKKDDLGTQKLKESININMSDFEVQDMPILQQAIVEDIAVKTSNLIEIGEPLETYVKEEIKFDVQMLEDKNDRAVNNQGKFLEPEEIFQELDIEETGNLQDKGEKVSLKEKITDDIYDVDEIKIDHKIRFDHKLELNLDKSEIEISEKYSKTTKTDPDYTKKIILTDPSQVDQSMVEKTLEEVQDSLDAVQEELIEVVKDGKLIKQSPSEFEFKILPHHIKYVTEPIHESFHEEITGGISVEPTIKEKLEWSRTEPIGDSTKIEEYTSISSTDESSSKVIHRVNQDGKTDSLNRWSIPDLDNSSSSESHYHSGKTDSRPCSSDLENLVTCGNSSEYQTAMDASLRPGSTEYVSAVSTFDHSGKTISSHESMKSLDSESSANLGSIEVSEISETLVASIADADLEQDMPDEEIDFEVDDKYCGVLMEEFDAKTKEESNVSHMKRSQEMIFSQDTVQKENSPEQTEKLSKSVEDSVRMFEEAKFSLEEGSILSSLSSTSAVDTVVENIDDLASSLGASSLAGFEITSLLRDDYTGTSFEEPSKTEKIDSMVMTSSVGQDQNTNYANTQITTVTTSSIDSTESERKRKGHKRNESNAFGATDFLKGISLGGTESSSLEEEDIVMEKESTLLLSESEDQDDQEETLSKTSSTPKKDAHEKDTKIHDINEEGQKISESESDTDPYESEYSRSFRSPTTKKKKNKKIVETFEKEQDHEKRPFTPSQSVSEIIVEDITEEIESIKLAEELERRPSQNMLNYSNIPDITITEDLQKYTDDDDDDNFEDKVLYKVQTQEELNKDNDTPLHYAKEHEFSITDDQFEEMVQRQYEKKLADLTKDSEEQPDSPDSFEMLEQPDISDEFVIIEEVAKEADEFDTEGKGMKIKTVKYVQKHDEEVEKILINSAPADPNQGSLMYRDEMNFDFEESPPSAKAKQEQEAAEEAATNKKWIEMQLSENAGQMRYPYELAGGVLEDIKEEDAEFEVGSSRISSFKDSFSSTPEYDVLAGRKYFAKEHDDVSMSSLQEFESLEQAISLENRKHHQGSQDSLSNGSFTRRYMLRNNNGQGDEIAISSLKEFEGLENACIEAHLIEIKAKEEAALLLSRSDESNKSGNGSDRTSAITSTTITTITTSVGQSGTATTIKEISQQEIEALIKSKLEECEEEPSNIMEVSTDSLDIAIKKSGSTNGHEERKGSEIGSSDSLEINKSGDIMTSSIDSFEISKDATARSSRSDVDSLEQQSHQEARRDSIDSIELEHGLKVSNIKNNQVTTERIEKTSDGQKTTTTTTTLIQGPTQIITRTITSVADSQPQRLVKDISNDSLNLNQTDPDLLLTSTESLDRTSSTATNATYQNENDSIMSSSITSCGSSTMIETLDTSFPPADLYKSGVSPVTLSQYFPDDNNKIQNTLRTITTTTTSTTLITKSNDDPDDDDVKYEQSDVSDNEFDKTNTTKIGTGDEEATPTHTKNGEQKKK